MSDAPPDSRISASALSGICCPAGVPTSRLPISLRALAELRLHAHHQVEELFALHHLRGRLPAHRRLHNRFHVGHVDAVARNLGAIHVDGQGRLPQLAHHRQFRESRNLAQPLLDHQRRVLQHVQVGSVDLHRQRALEARQRLVHRVFGRLRVVENHARKDIELALNVGLSARALL